jgi:hypothetical protein
MRGKLMPEIRPAALLAGFAVMSLIVLLPILNCPLPPILDYPNHMARMHILASAPLSGDLARYYRIAWSPIPDLAMDATVPLLARTMPVETAMRLFLGATLVGLAGGAMALHRAAFKTWSPSPLTAFLLLYNRMLLWGFLNYLAGLALALWALAAWIAMERRPPALRVAVGMIMAAAIYLAHLAAFGCYALAMLALAVTNPSTGRASREVGGLRRVLLALLTLMPAAVLFLLSSTSGAPAQFAYGNPLRKLDLPVSIFDNYNRAFDGATFAVLLLAVVVGVGKGAVRLHPRLRWCVAAILAAFVLLPSQFLSASGIDHRLPIAIAFLFVASSDLGVATPARRRLIGFALAGLFAVRMAVVMDFWLKADRQYATLLPSFDQIAEGGALAIAAPASAVRAGGAPLLHFGTIAVIKRNAFAPTLFADPHQQPVQFTADAAILAAKAPPAQLWQELSQGSTPRDLASVLAGYDDLMIIDPPPALDLSKLPGAVVFSAPRLLLVRLDPVASGRDR